MEDRIGIVGTGRLGKNLLFHLDEKGLKVSGIYNKNKSTSISSARICKVEIFDSLEETFKNSDIIFITTPDDKIKEIGDSFSKIDLDFNDKIFLHCSGSLPSTILENIKSKGGSIGSFHPLQSFACLSIDTNPFDGIIFGIEGCDCILDKAKKLAEILGGVPYCLKTEGKTLYHAAAVIASNYLVSLTDIALIFLESAGIEKKNGLNIIAPLMKGTLTNIISKGTKNALTGPVSRGDSETVSAHRESLLENIPQMDEFYKIMCRHTIKVAKEAGSISSEDVEKLLKVLK